jgi:hypothetical protein
VNSRTRFTFFRLCIEIPTSNGRAFEVADEEFLRKYHRDTDEANRGSPSLLASMQPVSYNSLVPVIVVFTKYDALVSKIDFEHDGDEDLTDEDLTGKADEEFERVCVVPLSNVCEGSTRPSFVKVSRT